MEFKGKREVGMDGWWFFSHSARKRFVFIIIPQRLGPPFFEEGFFIRTLSAV